MKPLTKKQLECLRDASKGDVNPFNYGSTTIARLKRENLLETVLDGLGCRRYRINNAGRKALVDKQGLDTSRKE